MHGLPNLKINTDCCCYYRSYVVRKFNLSKFNNISVPSTYLYTLSTVSSVHIPHDSVIHTHIRKFPWRQNFSVCFPYINLVILLLTVSSDCNAKRLGL